MLILSCIVKNLEILYEDDFSVVVNKPAGLAVQGGSGVKSSLDQILVKICKPGKGTPLLVHRLDKETSGVLLAAKGREAAAYFSHLLGNKQKIVKKYIAICSGCPAKKEGSITQELNIDGSIKSCETRYKVVKSGHLPLKETAETFEFSVLEMELGTGRMHQIRRHLAMIGNPILGDDKYGDFSLNKKLRKIGLKNLLLHASRLILKEKNNFNIHAPLPEYFHQFYNGNL